MELQFQNTPLSYLRSLTCQQKSQEQTQEVRISDGMPDIGTVLGAWGQVLLRSKQWNTNNLGLSGGVMVSVLYAPEEVGPPATVDVWIPFQEKFDLPDGDGREGAVHCSFHLTDVDARNTSARKLFVRVNLDTRAEALIGEKASVYAPGEMPEDVQLLNNTYPILLPVEAGEKPFELEETLTLPASCPTPEKIVYYRAVPRVQEQKVLSDKVIFRGNVHLHMLYLGQDQQLYNWDFQIPFSQYGELGQEYDPDSVVCVQMVLTASELGLDEAGQLQLDLGLVGQYVVAARKLLTITEDAYSIGRPATCKWEQLDLPMILDRQEDTVNISGSIPTEGMRLADVSIRCRDIRPEQMEDRIGGQLQGQFQALWYDLEGQLRSGTARWEQPWSIPADDSTRIQVVLDAQTPQGALAGGDINMDTRLNLSLTALSGSGIPMVTGLELGEWQVPMLDRPSVIVCRAEQGDLWPIAKANGATVEAIRKANRLDKDPIPGQLLLIPIS